MVDPSLEMADIPAALRRAIDDGELIVCAGPGVSVEAGLPRLGQLAASLLDAALAREPEGLDADALRAELDAGHVPEVLDSLAHALGPEFELLVEQALSDRGRPVPRLASAIARLHEHLRAVYTTRLDRLIERSFAGRWPSFGAARADLAQRRRVIFKLFGTLEFRNSWVLTRGQLRRDAGEHSGRRAVLDAAYRAHQLLLVGFEPDDPSLRELLALLPTQSGEQAPSHFVVMRECPLPLRRQLAEQGFELIDADAAELLESLGGAQLEHSSALEADRCPYPGLECFDEPLADMFFGRHAEISQAAARLGGLDRQRRWLAIDGPSGVGKSSFVRAGLVPALRNGFAPGTPSRWVVATMSPGSQPLRALAIALLDALAPDDVASDADELAARLAPDATTASELIRARLPPGHGLVLIIDQLEEAVTVAEPHTRAAFGAAVRQALSLESVYLITTMRSDLVAALQSEIPGLAELLNDAAERYALPAISRVGLREAITEPAARCGVQIEPELVEQILADASSDDGVSRSRRVGAAAASALPLVAHVLRGLWDAGAASDHVIQLHEYEALGGLTGAVSRSGDAVLSDLSRRERERIEALLLGLVQIRDGIVTRRTIRRDEALALAGGGHSGERLLARLAGADGGARLILVGMGRDVAKVSLVHEALLHEWGSLREWIEQSWRQLLLDEELDRRAQRWHETGRELEHLPQGKELEELQEGRPAGQRRRLHEEYQAALAQSERQRQRDHKRRRMVSVAVLAVVALGSAGVATVLGGKNIVLKQERLVLTGDAEQLRAQKQALEQRERELLELNRQLAATNAKLSARDESLRRATTLLANVAKDSSSLDQLVEPGEIEAERKRRRDLLEASIYVLDHDPNDLDQQRAVRAAHAALGDLEQQADNLEIARLHYAESLRQAEIDLDDPNTEDLDELAEAHARLGWLDQQLDALEPAHAHYLRALDFDTRREASMPDDIELQLSIVALRLRLAATAASEREIAEHQAVARARFAAITLGPTLLDDAPARVIHAQLRELMSGTPAKAKTNSKHASPAKREVGQLPAPE